MTAKTLGEMVADANEEYFAKLSKKITTIVDLSEYDGRTAEDDRLDDPRHGQAKSLNRGE